MTNRLLALVISVMPLLAWADYVVEPERTAQVVLSNLDVNRLVCANGKVTDVFFSKEKGVVVEIRKHDVFVKTQMKRNVATGEIIRPSLNLDLHVVCGGQVYTLVGKLKPIPTQTIRLTDRMEGVRANLKMLGAMPRERRIGKILEAAYRNDYPETFTIREFNEPFAQMGSAIIDKVRQIRVDGLGLRLTEYLVNVTGALTIAEKDFLQPAFGKHIAAVSIDATSGQLQATQSARVFVLEEGTDNGE